jgi:hypothetical protein
MNVFLRYICEGRLSFPVVDRVRGFKGNARKKILHSQSFSFHQFEIDVDLCIFRRSQFVQFSSFFLYFLFQIDAKAREKKIQHKALLLTE